MKHKIGHSCSIEKKAKLSKLYKSCGNTNWTGDSVSVSGGRHRTQSRYPSLGTCEKCKSKPATDRHHKDGITKNTNSCNIMLLCRKCHMEEDGRIENMRKRSTERLREKALFACGHERWRKCTICHKYDSPKNLYIKQGNVYHRRCNSDRLKKYTKAYRESIMQ